MSTARWFAYAALVVALSVSASVPALAAPFYLYNTGFETDTIGQTPTGWTVTSGAVNLTNTSVQTHPTAPSGGTQVLKVGQSGEAFELGVTFPAQSLNAGERLAYNFDINVDFINGNDSEGFLSRAYSTVSRIDAGFPRVLRNGTSWRLYNGNSGANSSPAYTANFNFDQWYRLRIEYVASSSSAGQVFWYMGDNALDLQTLADDLILTETYSGRNLSQTQNILRFDFSNIGLNGTGFSMFVDNLAIVTPEPAGLAAIGMGVSAGLLRRRQRAAGAARAARAAAARK